ncbi:ABC transporter ATP-binding protein [Trinickia violacea]|uniref:ABC transporter ATP-binding protein n=1 Tax=Trinickia violacea TaxID=2571746 RepID=A0A4P8IWC2_9BURK|nr:ABC transporter ATP-binding protein [Trinickia violacea]QCP50099.1 ABC transporter ATP-binding protein [Trinickia violacea]
MSALVDIRHLDAWYGASQVLFGVDLQVDAGEIVALVGRNASGRSTLAKAIVGLVRARGTIRFAGRELVGLRTFEIARLGLGYVAEQRDVFPALTVEENLQLGVMPGERGRARRFAADDAYALFPILAERRAAKAGALSGGEQQMLALARALMGEPRFLIVDEPAEGLAPQAVERVGACLRQLSAQGVAILLIEQRMQFARDLATRAAVIGGGRIVYEGRFDELDRATVDAWLAPG